MATDYGQQAADRSQRAIERRLEKIYRNAYKELKREMADHTRRFKAKDAEMRRKLKNGQITRERYNSWKQGQVFIGERWKAKVNNAAEVMLNANREAVKVINHEQLSVFRDSANYQAFLLEKDSPVNVSFDIYDTDAVARLIREQPELLPRRVINGRKDKAWNRTRIANAVAQGIVQGDDMYQIADRIAEQTASSDMKAMVRYARTAVVGAHNAGNLDALYRLSAMGVHVQKKWHATLDAKTRDSHQMLDGQAQELDDPFSSILGPIQYPGDPEAHPGNVYNCRCRIVGHFPDYANIREQYSEQEPHMRRDNETKELVKNMTYQEWAAMKQAQKTPEKQGEKSEVKPSGVDAIKKILSDHSGEWAVDDLIQLGEKISDEIERAGAENEQKLQAEYDEICRKIDEMESTGKDHGNEYLELLDKRWPLKSKIRQARSDATMETLKKFRSFGGATEKNVKDYADFSAYPYKKKEVKENLLRALNFYPTSWLNASKDFSRTLEPHWTSGRAYYGWGEIRISNRTTTNIHELGHRMEHVMPSILKAEKAFYEKRTDGLNLEWLGSGYRKDEMSRKDSFVDAYMGKDYGGVAYELVSMGFESVLAPNPRYDLTKDPEMRKWILGILAAL